MATHRRLYATYDSFEHDRLILSLCLSVVLVALSLRVTFFGVQSMQLSVFLSSLVIASMALVFVNDIWVAVLVACASGVVLSIVPALYGRCCVFIVGAGFGATLVSLVYTLVLEVLVEPTIELDLVATAVTAIVSVLFGRRALKRDIAFLIVATSCTGAFAVSDTVAITVEALGLRNTVANFIVMFVLGAGLLVCGIVSQKALTATEAAIEARSDEPISVTTPVHDDVV